MQMAEEVNFTTEKKELLSEKIHDEILELIIKNATEEEQVLNEKRLVELFGVSKAPIREALIKLCSEGVLKNIPRYGYVVVKMKEKDARDILKIRCILELEALKDGFETIVQSTWMTSKGISIMRHLCSRNLWMSGRYGRTTKPSICCWLLMRITSF